MSTLTINAGSSSLRFTLFDEKLKEIYKGHIDAIGQPHCHFRRYFADGTETKSKIKAKNHTDAIAYAIKQLEDKEIKKVAHRIVHGGEKFSKPLKLNALTIRQLERISSLAPLHNPANLSAAKAARKALKKAKHYAIFDTAFHSTIEEKAYLYGLPYELYKKQGIRRYGFHGTSHKYLAKETARILKKKNLKLITCHIGNGVSIAAIKNGVCLDTSMGFTPLEGPMMGTRSGSIDPAIIFHLAKKKSLKSIEHMLQHESGFKGLSGISSDIRKLRSRSKSPGTQRSFEVFSYQMAKIIMSYFTTLGGPPDAIIFSAGIGQNGHYLRKRISNYLKPFGLNLDQAKNNKVTESQTWHQISKAKSNIKALVIPTDEALQMAREIA